MKAYVLHEINNFSLEETADIEPEDGEVLVKVMAAGICGSDIPRVFTSGTYHYPLIPGHEFSGQVVRAGAKTDEKWVGKRVGVFPLIPCRECPPCKKGQYELCRNYSYLGSRRDGGFAEYVRVPVWNLLELPENVSYHAAAMLEPMAVAVHAMRRANPLSGERVAVCGLGTIGLLLAMFLKEAGIKEVFVIGNKDIQKEKINGLEIPDQSFCNTKNQDVTEWINQKTHGEGVDIFIDCVGKNETLNRAILNTAPNGRVQIVGNPYSDMNLEKNLYWKILRNQLTVLGTWNSAFDHRMDDDWNYVLNRLAGEKIRPEQFITHVFDLEHLAKGFEIMRDKSEDYIKIMGDFQ